ncbi:RES family NAD+ phosphorylase [Nitratireductor mangrovi]|uniref:RES family NAD+ phosphorylase n=1 Tax=Nitratireductor mangrovi TaxID=2599600 RepID=A0A5B8KU99_9HYPH|nr:RES family NAD+ phosphorylase [Nitratireductor mangrovi]QDY99152.1 RES family NAD+ phosphorylase [Nitratireductor mangrovi]
MRAWRISNYADLSGQGGRAVSGRWHVKGRPIIYCADHPSTSLLEILVHASRETVPDGYQLIDIDVPDDIHVIDVELPAGWERDLAVSQRVGSQFLEARKSAVLRVPSAIMPKAANLLINPLHPSARLISIVGTWRYPFDSRLFG